MDSVAFYPLFLLLTKRFFDTGILSVLFFFMASISFFCFSVMGGLLGELFVKITKTSECRRWPRYVFLELVRVPRTVRAILQK